ncbi:cupredoxin domain-containing protein [Anaeromyxobacter paludicola]|uniref:EfeO-type cupredoxin-like domain-containing protein n=1 Tax=Anaeromyxobacter paludicola TaxID=2918171 RepID=A0ABN6N406_9BACT|nr:cupredoxin domain-containing protein [Anaeromyxobacter paludicola]BDG07913.1 hypothetical protein AMPC_10260 [Anaeromyxobacter paludicola]
MNLKKLATLFAATALFATPALAGEHAHGAAAGEHAHGDAAGAKLSKSDQAKARTVEITVTKAGFEPAEVRAKAGEPLKLVVTRKTEKTCATEIVMKSEGVNVPLPLDKPQTVFVKPAKPGTIRYACGMDMIAGKIVVE